MPIAVDHPDLPGHLWFPYEGTKLHVRMTGYGRLFYKKIGLASVIDDNIGGLIAWMSEIDDPEKSVMFLIDGIQTEAAGGRSCGKLPRAILTDGELWCPLMRTVWRKYRSLPSYCHMSIMLSTRDQSLIVAEMKEYAKTFLGE